LLGRAEQYYKNLAIMTCILDENRIRCSPNTSHQKHYIFIQHIGVMSLPGMILPNCIIMHPDSCLPNYITSHPDIYLTNYIPSHHDAYLLN
jgi:hypothetical protein